MRQVARGCLFLTTLLLLGGASPAHSAPDSPEVWVHLFFSLRPPDGLARAEDILTRGKAVGVTHALLADHWLMDIDAAGAEYEARLRELKAFADGLGIELVPGVMQIGYSGSIMGRNPNLDEGMPVRDALYTIEGGVGRLIPDPEVALADGGFEQPEGDRFSLWDWQDAPGTGSFADREVVHTGACSLRMSDIGAAEPKYGHGRICVGLPLTPFRQYRASVWVKTRDFDTTVETRILVLGKGGERSLTFGPLRVEPTQDWTRYEVIFNSLDCSEANLYLGMWGGKTGTIWWDDAVVEEIGLVNVLRRGGTPLRVRAEDGTAYEEGRDFEPIAVARWFGDGRPEAVPLRLTAGSRIAEGERLRVSFYHAAHILGDQTMCCLSEPEVYDILTDQIRRVEEVLHPATWFMNHDEIRVANWCEACQSRHMTPGQLLADNARRCIGIIREASPGSRIAVWSDMFDPNHNAHGDYYAVNGSWEGSWEGLTPDILIANWYRDGGEKTMRFFADRGHRQILCGYYDNHTMYTGEWLREAQRLGIPGVHGAMYTTWVPQYDDLETWAEDVGQALAAR